MLCTSIDAKRNSRLFSRNFSFRTFCSYRNCPSIAVEHSLELCNNFSFLSTSSSNSRISGSSCSHFWSSCRILSRLSALVRNQTIENFLIFYNKNCMWLDLPDIIPIIFESFFLPFEIIKSEIQ